MSEQPPLFATYTVHCFFGLCPYVVVDHNVDGDRHDRMEAHYHAFHQLQINRLVYRSLWLNGDPTP